MFILLFEDEGKIQQTSFEFQIKKVCSNYLAEVNFFMKFPSKPLLINRVSDCYQMSVLSIPGPFEQL